MQIDEERVLAWIEGALDPAEAAAVAEAVAADPELAALASAHRALSARLGDGFGILLHDPIPPALAAAARPPATVTDLSAARRDRMARQDIAPRRFAVPQWAAIAATLVVGVIGGRMVGEIGPQPILTQGAAGLEAGGELAAALDGQLASAAASGPVRVHVTFRSVDGGICRSWSAPAQDGIACHVGDQWRIMASVAASTADEGAYRMAGSGNEKLLGLIDGMIDGEAFDAKREARAREDGWR